MFGIASRHDARIIVTPRGTVGPLAAGPALRDELALQAALGRAERRASLSAAGRLDRTAKAQGSRSPPIRRRISTNRMLRMATFAIWKVM